MNDTSTYKTKLEAEKVTLESELGTVGRRNPSNPGDWETAKPEEEQHADPLDRATALDSFQENDAILTDLEIRLEHVTAALSRIEDGSYGTCSACGGAIEEERLAADPAASTCTVHMNG